MSPIRIFAYLIQIAILVLLVFVVRLGPNRQWIVTIYILVSLFVLQLVFRRRAP